MVSDDALARTGLATLIGGRGVEVVAQATTADAKERASAWEPDVVAWDLGPGDVPAPLEGLDAPVVALLWDEAQGSGAVAAGARGIVLRDAVPERLAAALEAVARGLFVLDPGLAELLPRRRPAASGPVEPLTPRENQALQLLAEGTLEQGDRRSPGHQRAYREVPRQRDPGEAGRDDAHGSAGARRAPGARPSVEGGPARTGRSGAGRSGDADAGAMALPCEARSKKP